MAEVASVHSNPADTNLDSRPRVTSIVVRVPRAVADDCSTWEQFAQLDDIEHLLDGWGPLVVPTGVIVLRAPLAVLRYPQGALALPPSDWEETTQFPLKFAAAILTVSRRDSSDVMTPAFVKAGTYWRGDHGTGPWTVLG